jgi:pimeloyl-ACP methyl ester carboxylesterase
MGALERVDTGSAELACFVAGEGPVVICAHGFPDCARSFRLQVPALVGAGFRVVVPYLRGYAPSSLARDGRYDPRALGEDLCRLAQHYSPDAPVRLVGHDWGAIAGYAATALEPGRFSHLVAVAVPHLGASSPRWATAAQLRRSWYIGLFQLPRVAEAVVRRDGFALIDRLWRAWSPGWRPPVEELAQVKASFAAREHLAAVLGYYRSLRSAAVLVGETRRLLLRRTSVPTLYVHGEDDGCMGRHTVDGLERAFAGPVQIQRLGGAGHFVHQEKPDIFNTLLVRWLTHTPG